MSPSCRNLDGLVDAQRRNARRPSGTHRQAGVAICSAVRSKRAWAAAAVVLGVAAFWAAILAAAALEPGYANRRDYVSTLAAHGAGHAGLAMLGILAASGAMVATSLLLRQISWSAAVAVAVAGAGFVVVAFTPLDCPNGAAGCGLGGRFEVSGSTEIGHWTATTVSSVLLIVGIALTGVALARHGHRVAGIVSVTAAAVTAAAFLATGGDEPGVMQRIGIAAATGWLAALALAMLARERAGRAGPH
jgi:hypothetical protein